MIKQIRFENRFTSFDDFKQNYLVTVTQSYKCSIASSVHLGALLGDNARLRVLLFSILRDVVGKKRS